MLRFGLFVVFCTAVLCCVEAPAAPTIFDEDYVQERYDFALRQLREDHGSTHIKVARVAADSVIRKLEQARLSAKIGEDFMCSLCKALGEGPCDTSCAKQAYVWLDVECLD